MPLNEESKARINEFAKELRALMDTLDIRFWEGGVVRVAPAGAAPAFCTVEIEGVWDENVRWSGVPGGLSAGDEVLVWENPVTHRREIIGGSGGTATKPFVHDHGSATEGGTTIDAVTFGGAATVNAAWTHAANVSLYDGAGDSPEIRLIGGSNNDTGRFYLDDDPAAGDSDVALLLPGLPTDDSSFYIASSDLAVVAFRVDSNGQVVTWAIQSFELDLCGQADALILDDDGDTTISAPNDDQIDVEIGGTDYGTYTERVHAWDEVYDAGTWYDHQLKDATDGDHFRQNGATYPTGWTESDAAASVSTNDEFSFWYLRGTNADTSWKYRKQMSRAISDGTWNSFAWGPLLWRDGDFASDLHYWFGLYSDNGAGAIDEDIYIRVHLMWDSGGGTIGSIGWGIRGEEGDGSAGNEFTNPDHTGTWHVFGFPIHQPIWVRSLVRNVAAQTCRAYVGTARFPLTHTNLLDQNPTAANWDTTNGLWLQTHMSRGAGVEDYLYIGAVDYENAA